MLSSYLELLLTFGLGIIISAIIFLLSRRSLTVDDDVVLPKEDLKTKNKVSKQSIKIKVVKKDSLTAKPKNNVKIEAKSGVNVFKSHEASKIPENITIATVERIRNDSTAEWTKVTKPTKKPKKESKPELNNVLTNDENVKIAIRENNQKEVVKSGDKENTSKPKIENQIKTEQVKELKTDKVQEKLIEPVKTGKPKKFVTIEESKTQDTKTDSQLDEVKMKPVSASNESNEMKQQINTMMLELDKIKNNQKDDNKTNNQTNKEFELLKSKLKTSQANEEKLLEDLKKKGQAVTDLKNQFLIIQSELTKNIVSNQSIIREKLSLENRVRSFEEQQAVMTEKCQFFEQMKNENERLVKNNNAIEQDLKNVQIEYSDIIQSKERELLTQINMLQTEKHRTQDQLVRVQNDLIENNNKMQTVQQDLLTAKSTHADLLNENLRLQRQCSEIEQLKQQELTELDNKLKQNEEQIVCLKKQINDLNTMNINLSVLKSDFEKQIDHLHNSRSTTNNLEIIELSEKVKSLTQQLVDIKADLMSTQGKLEEHNFSCAQHMIQLKELTSERDNLLALVDQYKTGLESTESILSKLQMSVNEEESKWRESLMKSEAEVEKSKKELEIVYNDLMRIRNSRTEKSELNFAYHCVDKSLSSLIDEMEARMIHLEKSLETVIQERDNALSQASLQINGVAVDHEIVNGDYHSVLKDDSEKDKLKADLEYQSKRNETLENKNNKLKSLIDIGKDALDAEKSHVRELEEELSSLRSLTNNVSTNNVEVSLDA